MKILFNYLDNPKTLILYMARQLFNCVLFTAHCDLENVSNDRNINLN